MFRSVPVLVPVPDPVPLDPFNLIIIEYMFRQRDSTLNTPRRLYTFQDSDIHHGNLSIARNYGSKHIYNSMIGIVSNVLAFFCDFNCICILVLLQDNVRKRV